MSSRSSNPGSGGTDWFAWHHPYDDPHSALSRRLAAVQQAVAGVLEAAPPGPRRAVSVCAGQGRDLIGVLADHPRRADVTARLVEGDPRNAAAARAAAAAAGLSGVEVVVADGTVTDPYAGAVPADLVLACGVFGNVADDRLEAAVGRLRLLCAPGATLVWTRHRRAPDRTPVLRAAFAAFGFAELGFEVHDPDVWAVGTARLTVRPPPFEAGVRLFEFVGDGWRPA
ncbi:MAG TPA: hypothetical protein VKG43_05745 [Acidimicrobiales bacterium]|nr:hypothetical protein [Acidimicrobiales bacterium]